jgi:hypothetical protein
MGSTGGGAETLERLRDVVWGIARVTEPDASLEPEQRLRASMARYFAFAQEHAEDYRLLYEGDAATTPEVRALVDMALERQSDRLRAVLAPEVRDLPLVQLAVHGWMRFLAATCLRWLDDPSVGREALADLCVDTLFSAVASATRAGAGEEAW